MNTPSTVINIFILKIHSFENASAVNIGQNFLAVRNNSDKENEGCVRNYRAVTELPAAGSFVDNKDGIS